MARLQPAAQRATFEQLVTGSRARPANVAALRGLLARQTRFEEDPDDAGLDGLAEVLAADGEGIEALERAFKGQAARPPLRLCRTS